MKIYITTQAYLKLKYYTQAVEGEISGLGTGHKIDLNNVLIDNIYCFKQESSATATDLDKADVANFYQKMQNDGKDISEIRVWWHSHGKMEAYFSATDDETIKNSFQCDNFLISVVINRELTMKGRVDIFEPFKYELNANVEILLEDTKLKTEIDKEVEEKVNVGFSYNFSKNNKNEGVLWDYQKQNLKKKKNKERKKNKKKVIKTKSKEEMDTDINNLFNG